MKGWRLTESGARKIAVVLVIIGVALVAVGLINGPLRVAWVGIGFGGGGVIYLVKRAFEQVLDRHRSG